MSVFDHPSYANHEQVLFCRDARSDLFAIIAIHSTRLGPAAGGCRMVSYASEEDALTDALRLSQAMSYKNALAGLPLGGGKSVVLAEPSSVNKHERLRAFGAFVQRLAGQYWTAIDVGVDVKDIEIIAESCDYVFARVSDTKDRPDPSFYTALGGLISIETAVRHRWQKDSLRDLKVAIQGCGATGSFLAKLLAEKGARLTVTDIDAAASRRLAEDWAADIVPPESIYEQDVDIFAPCALGAVLNDETIPQLNAEIICGLANNQLLTPNHGELLREKNILYAPDFVVNAGGMLYASEDIFEGNDQERSIRRIHALEDTLSEIFERSERQGCSTDRIAIEMAEERIQAGSD